MDIYIDNDFKCHKTNPDGMYRKVQTNFFMGKCDTYIEGCIFVPEGEVFTDNDGTEFVGPMYSMWKNCSELDFAQREYEREKLSDAENALAILLGGDVT